MQGARLYLHERAFRDYGSVLARLNRSFWYGLRQVKGWCTEGTGERIIRWLVIAAGVAVPLYVGFNSGRAEYELSHNLAVASMAFLFITAVMLVFAAIYFVFVYFATTYIAALAGYLLMLAAGPVLGVLALVVLGTWLAVLLLLTLASALLFIPLRLCHSVWLLYHNIKYRCPYDDCRHSGLPIHVCSCGNEYADLKPNRFGILHHTCRHTDRGVKSEDVKLPTLFGRNRLGRLCRKCRRPLVHSSLGELQEWPIFLMGGPNAGKTMFLAQSVRRIVDIIGSRPQSIARLDSAAQQRDLDAQLYLMDRGQVLSKTAAASTAALGLAVRIPNRFQALVYLFDKPGEYFQSMRQFANLQAIEGLRGALLLADPFSLPGLEEHALAAESRLERSNAPLHTIAGNLVHAVEQMLPGGQQRCNVPLAVVLTKADALPVAAYPFLVGLMGLDHESPDTLNRRCRDALCRLGAENSVRLLEQKFSNVRYFACTATGRIPDPRDLTPFRPAGVEAPLLWLLEGAAACAAAAGGR